MRLGTTNPRRLHTAPRGSAGADRQRMSKNDPRERGRVASASRNTAAAAIRLQRPNPKPACCADRTGGSVSDGETGATLGTTGTDHSSAAATAHADEEAVRTLALDDRGLECALHEMDSALGRYHFRRGQCLSGAATTA